MFFAFIVWASIADLLYLKWLVVAEGLEILDSVFTSKRTIIELEARLALWPEACAVARGSALTGTPCLA